MAKQPQQVEETPKINIEDIFDQDQIPEPKRTHQPSMSPGLINQLDIKEEVTEEVPWTGTDTVFTGEETDVAWLGAGVIKALIKGGRDPVPIGVGVDAPKTSTIGGSLVEKVETSKPSVGDTAEDAMDTVGAAVDADVKVRRRGERPKDKGKFQKDIGNMTAEEVAAEADASSTLIKDSSLGSFSTTDTHQIPFHLFNSDDQVTAGHAAIAERYKAEIEKSRGPSMTHADMRDLALEQINQLAADVNMPPPVLEKFLRRQAGGDIPPVQDILAARFFLEKSAQTLKGMAWRIKKGDASERDKLFFLSQWDFHRQLNAGYMGARADWGRSGAAFRGAMTEGLGELPAGRMEELVNTYSGMMDLDTVVAQVITMETTGGINRVVQAQAGGMSKWGAAATELFISSVLSGLGTQINNAGGNAFMLVRAPVDLQLAAIFGIGSKYHADKVYGGEAAAAMIHMLAGWRRIFAAGMNSARSGEPYGGISKYDMGKGKAISAEALGLRGPLGWMADVFGPVLRGPIERVMGPIDAVFKVANEEFTYGHLAYRQMMSDVRTEGISNPEAVRRLNNYLDNPNNETVQEAVDFGLYQTFQNPLGLKGRALQKFVNSSALTKIIAPFIRTPGNILKVGFMENTPLFLWTKEMRNTINPKPLDTMGPDGRPQYAPGALAKAHRARARMMFGTMVAGYFAMMTVQGRVSGSGPKDGDQRKILMATGWRPRSILFRDESGKIYKTISYDGIEPIAQTIGLTVDFTNAMILTGYDDDNEGLMDEASRVGAALIFSITENSINKSYMYGIHEAMRAIEQADPQDENGGYYTRTYLIKSANAFIPFSGLRRDIRRLTDNNMRQTSNMFESLANQIPGLSLNLPARRNIWGEEMKYNSFYSNRYEIETIEQDWVDLEMQRLLVATKKPAVTLPNKKPFGVELNSFEYMELVETSRKTIFPSTGMDLKGEIMQMISHPDYAALSPIEQVDAIRGLVAVRDNWAKTQLFMNSESLSKKLVNVNTQTAMARAGRNPDGTPVDATQPKRLGF